MATSRPTPADLSSFLAAGEAVRWSGAPPKGLLFRGSDAVAIPISILWAGFMIFWNASLWLALAIGLSRGAPSAWDAGMGLATLALFPIVGLVFLGFAYHALIGPFISDAQDRARTFYVVTNYRAIIAKRRGRTLREIRGYELTMGGEISVKDRSRGTGSITFGQSDPWFGPAQQHLTEFVFDRIPNVREVARVVEEARRNAR